MNCKYIKQNRIENRILLYDRDFILFSVDDSDNPTFITDQTPDIVYGESINYSETETLDERYRFSRTVELTLSGYRQFDNSSFIIAIQDKDGVIYLLNPELECEVKWNFTLNSEGAKTVLTFNILENSPLIANSSYTYDIDCPEYISTVRPESLKIKTHDTSWIDDYNHKITTDGDDFQEIGDAYNIQLNEEMDEKGKANTTVTFNLPLNDNGDIWSFLQLPENKWNLIVTDSSGFEYYAGFHELGMECSYEVSDNAFNVTFRYMGGMPISVGQYSGATSDYTFWRYIDEWQKCVGGGYAIPTLQAEMDVLGRETGYYKCYVDLLDFFVHLGYNIVDTFSTAPLRKSDACAEQLCPAQVDRRLIEFTELIDTVEMTLQTNCPWSISGIPSWLEVSPDYGTGSTDIEFISTETANTSTTIYLNVEGGQSISIGVTNGMGAPFQNSYSVNAKYQQVTVNVTGFVVVNSDIPYSTTSSGIVYDVPENRSTSSRTFTSTVLYQAHQVVITIEQAGIREKWEDTTGFICESGDTWYRQELLLSYDGENWFSGNQYRPSGLAVEGQDLCSGYLERWVQNGYFCFEGEQYHALVLQVSTDGGTTWTDTMDMDLGPKVNQSAQQHFNHCDPSSLQEQWVLTDKTYCKIDD